MLQWRVAPGSNRTTTQVTQMTQVLDANGLEVKTGASQTMVTSAVAGQPTPDGRIPLRHQVESLAAKIELPFDLRADFDSQKELKPTGTNVDPVLHALKAYSSANWTTLLDRKMKAVAVEGNEQFLAQLSEETQQGLNSQLSDEALKRSHNQLIDSLPVKPVAVGDTWTRKQFADFDLGQIMEFEKRYRYEGVAKFQGRPFDKISQEVTSVTVQLGENPLELKLKESDLKVNASEGTIYFDRRTGWIHYAEEETKISGQLSFELRDKVTHSKVRLTLANKTSVK